MKRLSTITQEYLISAASMLLGIVTIITALFLQTPLSNLVATPYEFLYIMMLASTSLSLFRTPNWRLPAILILLVAAFPTPKYLHFHYIWSILFFMASYLQIFQAKRFSYYAYSLLPALLLLAYYHYIQHQSQEAILAFETLSITAFILHHTSYLIYRIRIGYRKGQPTSKSKAKSKSKAQKNK